MMEVDLKLKRQLKVLGAIGPASLVLIGGVVFYHPLLNHRIMVPPGEVVVIRLSTNTMLYKEEDTLCEDLGSADDFVITRKEGA